MITIFSMSYLEIGITNKGRGSWLKMGIIVIVLFLLLMIPLTQQFFIPLIKKQMSITMIKNHSLSEGDVIMFGDNAWNNTWCVLKIEDSESNIGVRPSIWIRYE